MFGVISQTIVNSKSRNVRGSRGKYNPILPSIVKACGIFFKRGHCISRFDSFPTLINLNVIAILTVFVLFLHNVIDVELHAYTINHWRGRNWKHYHDGGFFGWQFCCYWRDFGFRLYPITLWGWVLVYWAKNSLYCSKISCISIGQTIL